MDAAKEKVGKFLHSSGKHTAELHQTTNAPVTHENVRPTEQKNTQAAVDREVHQTHHQTQVQPILDKEQLPTQHHHDVLPVEHRSHHHGHDANVKEKLAREAAQFEDRRQVAETQHVSGKTSEVVGEHHHHHIHNTTQPVIQKETVQPHVVHTTVPIHEKIDMEPTVHKSFVAKPMSMDEFKRQAGAGETSETINYEGNPLDIHKDARVGFESGSHHGHGAHPIGAAGGATSGTGLGQGHTGTGSSGPAVAAAAAASGQPHHEVGDRGTDSTSGHHHHHTGAQQGSGIPQSANADAKDASSARLNDTGFIDGRSSNDDAATESHEKKGGLIGGLINKMKS